MSFTGCLWNSVFNINWLFFFFFLSFFFFFFGFPSFWRHSSSISVVCFVHLSFWSSFEYWLQICAVHADKKAADIRPHQKCYKEVKKRHDYLFKDSWRDVSWFFTGWPGLKKKKTVFKLPCAFCFSGACVIQQNSSIHFYFILFIFPKTSWMKHIECTTNFQNCALNYFSLVSCSSKNQGFDRLRIDT